MIQVCSHVLPDAAYAPTVSIDDVYWLMKLKPRSAAQTYTAAR